MSRPHSIDRGKVSTIRKNVVPKKHVPGNWQKHPSAKLAATWSIGRTLFCCFRLLLFFFLPHFPISRVQICFFLPVSFSGLAASSFLAWTGLINRITCQSYRTQNKKAVLWYLAFTAGRDHGLYRSLLIIYPERPGIFHPGPSPLRNGKTRMRFIILWSVYGRYADSRSQTRWRGVFEVDRQEKFLARYFSRARPGREAGTQPGGRIHTCTFAS